MNKNKCAYSRKTSYITSQAFEEFSYWIRLFKGFSMIYSFSGNHVKTNPALWDLYDGKWCILNIVYLNWVITWLPYTEWYFFKYYTLERKLKLLCWVQKFRGCCMISTNGRISNSNVRIWRGMDLVLLYIF